MQYPHHIDPSRDTVPLFEYRRPTRDWIGACLFRLVDGGFAATLLHEGDKRRGTVLFLLAGACGTCRHYTQVRRADGQVVWTRTGGRLDPVRSAVLIRAAIGCDPDLWICRIGALSFRSWSAEQALPAGPARTFTPSACCGTGAFT